jgi:hypothetical protein
MNRKIPPEAFTYYVGLGTARSYDAVATKYGVSKRAVTKCATREHWQERFARIQQEAREKAEKRAVESMEQVTSRQLTALKFMFGKALETLRTSSLDSAMDAVRTALLCIKQEREIRGETADESMAETLVRLRRELETCFVEKADVELPSTSGLPPAREEVSNAQA